MPSGRARRPWDRSEETLCASVYLAGSGATKKSGSHNLQLLRALGISAIMLELSKGKSVENRWVIRNIRAADAPQARELLLELGHDNDVKSLAWRISAMEGTPRERVVVVEMEGRLVGLAAASVYRYFHVDGLVCRVTALVVHRDFRRRGIGKALVAWAESWAGEQGCDRMEITARREKAESLEFLRHLGYEDTSRRFFKHLGGAGNRGEA